ncbi:MAG TPA: iron-containing alcohol dehydrogenase [Spirochaetota bacterium]|nr:iron-containing alcohol dehydrogenase [Spirochaetota bacterium]HPI89307.1 iron-containing alcohol dehydrogenase [Spirochaetota bacterium]HPR48544.1 iron-containing alcohol dehydrogenase [Spirochaetota bacterium]
MILPRYSEFCGRVKTLSGASALEAIPGELKKLNASKALIITDRGVVAAGLIKIVKAAITGKGSRLTIGAVFDDTPPDSDYKVVNAVAKVYKEKKCDAIIAVGGGSVLDTAKGVNILVSLGGDNLLDYEGAGAVKQRLKPLVAVPTTAGTGSEMTLVAVIADHDRHVKMTFVSYFLLPDIAVLDPRMTKTLPAAITAFTGMDAMTHAVEAYFCLGKNPLSDTTAFKAIQLISNNIMNAVKNPGDMESRLAMANAAALAGIAFSNSMVGLVHNLGHATGAVCHVPHGVCMSIYLPYGLEYNLHKVGDLIGEILYPLAGAEVFAKTPKKQRPLATIEYIRGMNEKLKKATGGRHATALKDIVDREGKQMVPRDAIPVIAKNAMGDGAKIYNPEEQSYEDNIMVIEAAWEGVPLDLKKIKKGPKKQKF